MSSNSNEISTRKRASFQATVEPVTLSWRVSVKSVPKEGLFKKIKSKIKPNDQADANPVNDNVKIILNQVNGLVKPGQLCAIMGASGAGKTTLLNVLNFRNQGKLKVEGEVKLNGRKADWDLITRYSGYVQQDDLFIPTMTVREHLTFLAMLKMGFDYSREDRLKRVDQILEDLSLIKAENILIGQGDQIKGISGGEKRRLAFASEILTNPPLLFCDEPTSGLDSYMAQTLVESMKSLSQAGKTVVCTIHQPSSQVFELFDTLCLLAEGRCVYLGPSTDAMRYFADLGYPVPNLYNPADFYIQTLAIEPNDRENSLQKVKEIADSYEQGPINAKVLSEMTEIENYATENPNKNEQIPRKYNASYLSQFYWLFGRQFTTDIRDPIATKVLLLQSVIIGAFLGLIFLQLNMDQTGIQNKLGVLFIVLMQCNFGYIFSVVNSFPLVLPLIFREVQNRYYSIVPFYCVKQFAELPKYLFVPLVFISIVYWMSGIYNDGMVFFNILALFLVNVQVAIAIGTLVSVAAPNLNAALAVIIPIIMPILIFAGFFLGNKSVPVYFIWIKYISWFYYANEAINIQLWTNVKNITCEAGRNASSCYSNGSQVLQQNLQMDPSNLSRDIGLLIMLAFIPRILSFWILRFKSRRS